MMAAVTARAPGKLVLAGEFAVLHAGHPAIVAAVSRYVHVRLREGPPEIRVSGGRIPWRWTAGGFEAAAVPGPMPLVAAAMSAALDHSAARGERVDGFTLEVSEGFHDRLGAKLGLGSSAATVVAVVAAVLGRTQADPDRTSVFKLAMLAHYLAQGAGSGADVAAAAFGGPILYRAVDPAWLSGRLGRGERPSGIAAREWPGLAIEQLGLPALPLHVGFVGASAATSERLALFSRQRRRRPVAFTHFLASSDAAVLKLAAALRCSSPAGLIEAVGCGRRAIWGLTSELCFPVETPKLSLLADAAEELGGAGKSSGAGGGDCGFAFVERADAAALRRRWRQDGILPLPVAAVRPGVELTDVHAPNAVGLP